MKVVFHLTNRDPDVYADVLRSLEALLDDETLDLEAVEVVANGGGLGLLLAGTEFGDRIDALQERGVVFKASANTSSRSDLSAEDLVEGVGIVSSGVGEIARLQSEGYAYLRP